MTLEPILNQLKGTLRRAKGCEAMAFWATGGAWKDAVGETLEHEEIVFYAEGLLMEGHNIAWQVVGDESGPDHLRLFFWHGDFPPLPAVPAGLKILETVRAPEAN